MVATKTKVSTKTKVAIGIAVAAGGLIVANMLIRNYYPTYSYTNVVVTPTPVTRPTMASMIGGLNGFNLSYGANTLSRVQITAPAGHDLGLYGLAFRVDLNLPPGFTLTYPFFYGAGVMGTFVTDASCGFTPTATSLCLRVPFKSELLIPAGTTTYMTLGGQINGPAGMTGLVSGNSITTTLLTDTSTNYGTLSGSGTTLGIGGTPQNFVWSDRSSATHSLTSNDWWNGSYAYGLPIAQALLRP